MRLYDWINALSQMQDRERALRAENARLKALIRASTDPYILEQLHAMERAQAGQAPVTE